MILWQETFVPFDPILFNRTQGDPSVAASVQFRREMLNSVPQQEERILLECLIHPSIRRMHQQTHQTHQLIQSGFEFGIDL
jgi:hypothetical protein